MHASSRVSGIKYTTTPTPFTAWSRSSPPLYAEEREFLAHLHREGRALETTLQSLLVVPGALTSSAAVEPRILLSPYSWGGGGGEEWMKTDQARRGWIV